MKAMRPEAAPCSTCGEYPVWWMAWDGDSRLTCRCTYRDTLAWLNRIAGNTVLSPSPEAQETRAAGEERA